jgi:hypothetical protein
MRRIAMTLALCMLAGGVEARPPENADPALAPWFKSLRTEDGGSCYSEADCRPVEYRVIEDHYEALIGQQFGVDPPRWLAVPRERILKKTDNPLGRAVACWPSPAGCPIRAVSASYCRLRVDRSAGRGHRRNDISGCARPVKFVIQMCGSIADFAGKLRINAVVPLEALTKQGHNVSLVDLMR